MDLQSVAGQPVYSLIIDGRSIEAYVLPGEEGVEVMLGGRLYHIPLELDYYLAQPLAVFKVWQGGLAIHGVLIAGIVVLVRWLMNQSGDSHKKEKTALEILKERYAK